MTTVTLNINFEVDYSGSIEATFSKPTDSANTHGYRVFTNFSKAKTYARKMINNSQLSANEREYKLWNLRDEDLEQTTIDDLLEYIQESDDYSVKEIK